MPSLVPTPPQPPGAANTTTIYDQPATWALAAGAWLYGVNLNPLLYFGASTVDIRGSLWLDAQNEFGGIVRMAPHRTITTVANSGQIVARGFGTTPNSIELFIDFRTVTNSGDIYAVTETGYAVAFRSYESSAVVTNSGLIAVYAGTMAANGVHLVNGGRLINQAAGRILAEGAGAIAVLIEHSALEAIDELENHGTIEARSIPGGNPAIGAAMLLGPSLRNTGLIRGDIGVHAGSADIVNSGRIEGSLAAVRATAFVRLTNLAGGVIAGDVVGGDDVGITDSIRNWGTITGGARLGIGNDLFVNESGGTIAGVVDLGFGNDSYTGSAEADRVAGDNGLDTIEGRAGNDLLLGGNDNDVLIGGAGNDRLYGERGDDRLVLAEGDYGFGGTGHDRIELSDYSFAFTGGGSGSDTLVLAAGARALSLASAIASGRIEGFEAIELRGGQEIAVAAADVLQLADASELRIVATASDKVHLVGAWSAAGPVTVDGAAYQRWTLDGAAVLVSAAATVQVAPTAPANMAGLDAVAPGFAAPAPGPKSGIFLTPDELYVQYLEIVEPTLIYEGETWFTFGKAPALYAWRDSARLDVRGVLIAVNEAQATAVGVEFMNFARIVNEGGIRAVSTGAVEYPVPSYFPVNREGAYAVRDALSVVNRGVVEASSRHGMAVGLGELEITLADATIPFARYRSVNSIVTVENSGTVSAAAETGHAIGIVGGVTLTNAGGSGIVATGAAGAIGVYSSGRIDNHGLIAASGGGETIAVLFGHAGQGYILNNSGTISAAIAIRMFQEPGSSVQALQLDNGGSIWGAIDLGGAADRIVNRGAMAGEIALGGGNDSFEGAAGRHDGAVLGEEGDDSVRGGRGAQRIDGGTGNDSLGGGGGIDTLTGGAGADVFVFSDLADTRRYERRSDGRKYAPDQITDFKSGEDRIDLSGIDAIWGTAANDAFTFVGQAAFAKRAGELRWESAGAGRIHLLGDVDGDGVADLHLIVFTETIAAGDFLL